MKIFDVNVLVNAFRTDAPGHEAFRRVLDAAANGPSPFALSRIALSGFLRISTHPKIFDPPSPLSEALAFCEDLKARSGFRWVEPGARHWEIFTRLCRETNALANLIPDAWFAALAIESGSTWITGDRDYRLFGGLEMELIVP